MKYWIPFFVDKLLGELTDTVININGDKVHGQVNYQSKGWMEIGCPINLAINNYWTIQGDFKTPYKPPYIGDMINNNNIIKSGIMKKHPDALMIKKVYYFSGPTKIGPGWTCSTLHRCAVILRWTQKIGWRSEFQFVDDPNAPNKLNVSRKLNKNSYQVNFEFSGSTRLSVWINPLESGCLWMDMKYSWFIRGVKLANFHVSHLPLKNYRIPIGILGIKMDKAQDERGLIYRM